MGAYVLADWWFSKSFSNEDSSPCLRLGDYRFLLILYVLQEKCCSLFVFCYMISEGRVADAGAGSGQLGSEGILQLQQYFI